MINQVYNFIFECVREKLFLSRFTVTTLYIENELDAFYELYSDFDPNPGLSNKQNNWIRPKYLYNT